MGTYGRSRIRPGIAILVCSLLLSPVARGAATIILVRHGEIAQAAPDPPLSSQGQKRAESLALILRDAHLNAIYVTEYRRTQQMGQPSADRFHLRPEKMESRHVAALVEAIRRYASGTVLVIGHSNTLPAIISMLGGPAVRIGTTEYDNLFVVTLAPRKTSLLQLHYGDSGPAPPAAGMRNEAMLNNRSPVMQIDFVKSGGFGFPLRKAIKATIKLKGDGAEVSSDATYQRTLPADEAEQLRVGADPVELEKAAAQITRNQKAGAADMDHYRITITTKDGKSHNLDLNTSLASNELDGVPPAVVKFLRWIQDEAQKIKSHSLSGQ